LDNSEAIALFKSKVLHKQTNKYQLAIWRRPQSIPNRLGIFVTFPSD